MRVAYDVLNKLTDELIRNDIYHAMHPEDKDIWFSVASISDYLGMDEVDAEVTLRMIRSHAGETDLIDRYNAVKTKIPFLNPVATMLYVLYSDSPKAISLSEKLGLNVYYQ